MSRERPELAENDPPRHFALSNRTSRDEYDWSNLRRAPLPQHSLCCKIWPAIRWRPLEMVELKAAARVRQRSKPRL